MSGNTTSLYSTTSSNGTTGSNNFTTLYPSQQGVIVPTTPYGNANVVALLNAGTDGGNTVANIIATGTVTAGNVSTPTVYNQGMAVQGYDYVQMQYSNSVTLPVSPYDIGVGSWFYLDPGGGVFQSNTTGALKTVVLGNDGSVSATGNLIGGNILTAGAISATGNVTANYFLGNGSQLTGITVSAGSQILNGNSNVTVLGNSNVTVGIAGISNVVVVATTGEYVAGVVSATGNITGNYFIGNGSQLTGIAAGNYSNANATSLLAAFGSNVISTTGTVTAGNITGANIFTAGQVSATGNVTGNYIIGNGSQLTGLPATYSNANVATFLANFGSNSISTTGNVTAGYFLGNGSLLTSITGANVTGTVANATYALNANAATYANVVTDNAQPNITSVGTLTSVSVTGNTTVGNLLTGGIVSAAGNVTGNYFIGNGSQLTGITANAAGSNTQIQYNNAGAFAGNAAMTFNNTTGNIGLGNLVIGIANGNASYGGTAAIFTNPTAFSGGYANSVAFQAGQILVGNGYFGNLNQNLSTSSGARGSKFLVWDSANITDGGNAGVRYNVLGGQAQAQLLGNLTSNNTFFRAQAITLAIGGGSAGNTLNGGTFNGGGQGLGAVAAISGALNTGNQSATISLGNVTISGASAIYGQIFNYNGSQITNAIGINTQIQNSGNIPNIAGIALQFTGNNTLATTAVNCFGVYMPSNVASTQFSGIASINKFRAADNFYFLYNDDAVAQTKLGSLRSYNEFRYDTATTGNITIDKNNAQVQYIAPTGNVTIDGYANMVTTLNDSVNQDQEIDTLTVLVQQGATPYTVTLPTGSTYQYAGNVSTVPAVANARSILTVVAANVAGTVNYFTTVQSDQTTQEVAAGSNTQIQYNNAGVMAGNAAMTFDNTTGNVTLANVTIGTVSGYNPTRINTSTAWIGGNTANTTSLAPGQMLIGNGYFGNLNPTLATSAAVRGAKLVIWDSANVVEPAGGGVRYNGLTVNPSISVGNIANTNSTVRGGVIGLNIGGGASANTWSTNLGPGTIVGVNQALWVGQPNTSVAVGNITVTSVSGSFSQILTYAGSNIGNAVGVFSQINNAANTTTIMGYGIQFTGTGTTTPTNAFGVYMPASSPNTYSFVNSNSARSATNYYFLKNDDNVAQNQLGSLRAYHTFQAAGNTSGTWNIDKDNGQVQAISATGNVTIGSYTNFVTTANDGTNNDNQTDTVTLIIEQGSTPFTVTMPTGNAAIKYANGVSTVTSTANTTTMIAITAYRTAANATGYLTTISPAFS